MFYLLGRTAGSQLPDDYIAAAGEVSIEPLPAGDSGPGTEFKKEMTRGGQIS
jgi:hypothetical protein